MTLIKYKQTRYRINAKRFIEVYFRCDYNWQVAEKLGVSVSAVNSKVTSLRRQGVKIPPRYERDDVDDLNKAIEEIEAQIKASQLAEGV